MYYVHKATIYNTTYVEQYKQIIKIRNEEYKKYFDT